MSSLPGSLRKEKRWDPDSLREASWRRRKRNYNYGLLKRSQSFTNDDVNELEACFELGFGFDDSDDLDPKLTDAFPALEFYNAVVKNNSNCLSRSPSSVTVGSDIDSDSLVGSPASNSSNSLFTPGEDPTVRKMRLKQWARVVACSVRHQREVRIDSDS